MQRSKRPVWQAALGSAALAMPVLAMAQPVPGTSSAPTASPAAASTGKSTLQQRFDAATTAWDEGNCAAVLPLLTTLAAEPAVKPGTLPANLIGLRRGYCLIQTGKADVGEPMLADALPRLKNASVDLSADIVMGETALGNQAMARWDRDTALAHYRTALALLKGEARAPLLVRIAMVTMFDRTNTAIDAANEGLALQAGKAKPDKIMEARWHTLIGRTLLNQGDIQGGYAHLTQALSRMGGLDTTVSLEEAMLRQDLAQAALLTHRNEEARRYMAMSGAGRIAGSAFAKAAVLDAPTCGPDTGLSPDDMAVIEFAVDSDGQVIGAQPVYSTAGYAKATALARAVSQWRWKPEDAASLPQFFRYSARVEVRCTRSEGSASVVTPALGVIHSWTSQQLGAAIPGRRDDWPAWLALAEAARTSGNAASELAARVELLPVDLRNAEDQIASVDRALSLLGDPAVPAPVRNLSRVLLMQGRANALREKRHQSRGYAQPIDGAVAALADEPAIAADPLAQSTALLLAVPARPSAADAVRVTAMVMHVANDDRLPTHHPLRQYAQLRLANDFARQGNMVEAQRRFLSTGLTETQCALIGPKPVVTQVDTASAYPTSAIEWGMEGWTISEFDILADGRTSGTRILASYPPFVFDESATQMMSKARYQSSFRPTGMSGCSAKVEPITFSIPGNANTAREIKRKS